MTLREELAKACASCAGTVNPSTMRGPPSRCRDCLERFRGASMALQRLRELLDEKIGPPDALIADLLWRLKI